MSSIELMDGEELLRRLRQRSDHQEKSKPIEPVIEAQAMELYARWQAAQSIGDLRPGMLVQEKHGLGWDQGSPDKLLIIWRMLDPASRVDRRLIKRSLCSNVCFCDNPDCLTGELTPDGRMILTIFPHQLSMLRQWQDPNEPAADGEIRF